MALQLIKDGRLADPLGKATILRPLHRLNPAGGGAAVFPRNWGDRIRGCRYARSQTNVARPRGPPAPAATQAELCLAAHLQHMALTGSSGLSPPMARTTGPTHSSGPRSAWLVTASLDCARASN